MTLKQDLKALQKEIKALEKKMNKLIAAAGKNAKPKSAKKTVTRPPFKAKTTKNAPAKKALANKKPRKLTATDIVLGVLMAQKEGISVANLINKTRFDEKKIQNILYRASKRGKIKRVEKGVFTAV